MRLDVTGRCATTLALHHVAQNSEANRMAEGTQLLGMTFNLRCHTLLLTFSNHAASALFDSLRSWSGVSLRR